MRDQHKPQNSRRQKAKEQSEKRTDLSFPITHNP